MTDRQFESTAYTKGAPVGELWGQVSITQGGAAAIVAPIVLLVLLGRLVSLRQLEALRKDKDEQIATWRATAEREAAARMEIQRQNGELLELARTAGHVLTAFPTPPQGVTASAPVAQLPTAPTS
jgi:hypothetical protein